uniref:Transmembrane protein 82 n=1 Tax=Callorhinchus milii TaxID=7868 RepID=A0A4W3J2E3_CALMI
MCVCFPGGVWCPGLPAVSVFPGLWHDSQPELPERECPPLHVQPGAEHGPGRAAGLVPGEAGETRDHHVPAPQHRALLRGLPLAPHHLAPSPRAARTRHEDRLRCGRRGRHLPHQQRLPHGLRGPALLDTIDHLLHPLGHLHARWGSLPPSLWSVLWLGWGGGPAGGLGRLEWGVGGRRARVGGGWVVVGEEIRTRLFVLLAEEQKQKSSEQSCIQTVCVRMGGLLILTLTVGRWVDVLHVLLSLLGELWCLIRVANMLEVCRLQEAIELQGRGGTRQLSTERRSRVSNTPKPGALGDSD